MINFVTSKLKLFVLWQTLQTKLIDKWLTDRIGEKHVIFKLKQGLLQKKGKKFLQINKRLVTLTEHWENDVTKQFTELIFNHRNLKTG